MMLGMGFPFLAAAALPGCSSETHDKLLHFFFEVPAKQTAAPHDETRTTADSASPHPDLSAGDPAAFYRSIHQPFAERNCAACHDTGRKMGVRQDVMAACRTCHERYFTSEATHPPVQKAQCAKCHEPHRARESDLLSRALFDTCMECHDPPEELSRDAHSGENVRECTRCHDAHFGEGVRLKTGAPWPP
jgi:predicted CXXCH cytochrome family protein